MKHPEVRRPSVWRTLAIGVVVTVLVGSTLLVLVGIGIAMSKPSFGSNK